MGKFKNSGIHNDFGWVSELSKHKKDHVPKSHKGKRKHHKVKSHAKLDALIAKKLDREAKQKEQRAPAPGLEGGSEEVKF